MRERPNRMVSKTIVAQVTVGSNPTPSALENNRRAIVTATRAIGVAVACAVFLFVAVSPAGARVATTAHESAANALGAGEAVVVGGVAVIVLSRTGRLSPAGGRGLGSITTRDAMIIGGAQVFALWPGTSRSLVTIVAALLLGISMSAAVEFSFLLGFVTLGAATA